MALVLPSTAKLKKFYHQTFEIKKGTTTVARHTLLVNPSDMSVTEPARAQVTQTLGGAFVQDFGQGLPQVTISGITGYKARYNSEGELRDGFEEFRHFRDQIYRKFISENIPDYSAYWYNWEDEEYYQIQPMSFRLQRSKSEPLLYRYEFQFVCLQRAEVRGVKTTSEAPDFSKMLTSFASAMSGLSEALSKLKR